MTRQPWQVPEFWWGVIVGLAVVAAAFVVDTVLWGFR